MIITWKKNFRGKLKGSIVLLKGQPILQTRTILGFYDPICLAICFQSIIHGTCNIVIVKWYQVQNWILDISPSAPWDWNDLPTFATKSLKPFMEMQITRVSSHMLRI